MLMASQQKQQGLLDFSKPIRMLEFTNVETKPISSMFFLPTLVKIFMASFKIFSFLSQNWAEKAANGARRQNIFIVLHDIV